MVRQFIQLKKVQQPLKNEATSQFQFDDRWRYVSAALFEKVRRMPEFLAMLDTVVSDHFMGPVDFFDLEGNTLGPTKDRQARKFWIQQNVQRQAFYGQGLDYFMDGSSFGWHVSANQVMSQKQKEAFVKLKAVDFGVGQFAEESMHLPRKVSYIAASTTEIVHNEYGDIYYVQDAAGQKVRWGLDQIVHIKRMDFNGEIRGNSAAKALSKEAVMMFMLKDNILAALENGGSPDTIISLKGANGVSKSKFHRLRTALESFSHLKKSHGNMPIDAEIETHEMGTTLKDMEYRQLAMFVISEFGLALNLPTSKIPFLMTGDGGTTNKGQLSGNSEDSYQSIINTRRTQWETAWNQVFMKAGFLFRFRRDNLQDEIKETQASVQRTNNVQAIQSVLSTNKQKLTEDALLALLSGKKKNISSKDVEDMTPEEIEASNPIKKEEGPDKNNYKNDDAQAKGRVSQDISQAKKETAFNNGRSN